MHLVSCRQTMSGRRSDSQFTMLSMRCLIELTFQLAMRMGRRFPVFKLRVPAEWRISTPSESSVHAFVAALEYPRGGGCRRTKPCAKNKPRCDGVAFRVPSPCGINHGKGSPGGGRIALAQNSV